MPMFDFDFVPVLRDGERPPRGEAPPPVWSAAIDERYFETMGIATIAGRTFKDTDDVGDEASNMKLSHDRAKAVREYLVNRGTNPDRIQAKGYGELNPIATNDTDDGRKANRRTEFVILDF